MKTKHLKKGELRIIQIDENAIFELLKETMMENASEYFDVLDVTKVTFEMKWLKESGQFICAVYDSGHCPSNPDVFLDLAELGDQVGLTTRTLYGKHRYKTLYLSDDEHPGL